MNMKEEIKSAIASHGKWKGKLKKAIETGKIDAELSAAKTDNQCDFGKWLYGLTEAEKKKYLEEYERIQQLHAIFHDQASKVVLLAQSGNKAGALKMLGAKGGFTVASGDLSSAMLAWFTEMK